MKSRTKTCQEKEAKEKGTKRFKCKLKYSPEEVPELKEVVGLPGA